MLGGLVVHLLSQTRRFLALLVASAAAEAVLFLLWVIALLPFWSRDNSRESLRFEAVAHAVAAAVVAAQIFVSREDVLRSFGGDLGPPSIVRAAFGCVLLLWAARRRPAAVPVGAFGAALIANHGISWFGCFVLSACYQLWSGLPRRGDSAETEEVARVVTEALRKVGGDAGAERFAEAPKAEHPLRVHLLAFLETAEGRVRARARRRARVRGFLRGRRRARKVRASNTRERRTNRIEKDYESSPSPSKKNHPFPNARRASAETRGATQSATSAATSDRIAGCAMT